MSVFLYYKFFDAVTFYNPLIYSFVWFSICSAKFEIFSFPLTKTYAQRIAEASESIGAFFDEFFSDIKDQDRICSIYDKQIEVFRDVYFELGLITGAKLMLQLSERMKDIS